MTTKIELTPPYPVGTKKWALWGDKALQFTISAWDISVHESKIGVLELTVEWHPVFTNGEGDRRYIHGDLYDTAEELKQAIFDA